MAAEQVCVVGGANSAGQAALYLARFAARGHAAHTGRVAGRPHVRHLITQLKATRHRSPAPYPSSRRPRPSPPGSPHARGRPDRPACTGPRRGCHRHDRRRAAHTVTPGPRQTERWWIHPDRPRRSPRAYGRRPSTLPFGTSLPGDQDPGCPDPGNLRAVSRAGQSDRLQLGPPGVQAIRVCRK
jgi:hypothetical protein